MKDDLPLALVLQCHLGQERGRLLQREAADDQRSATTIGVRIRTAPAQHCRGGARRGAAAHWVPLSAGRSATTRAALSGRVTGPRGGQEWLATGRSPQRAQPPPRATSCPIWPT